MRYGSHRWLVPSLRIIGTLVVTLGAPMLLAIAGAWGGAYLGFYLVGVPTGEHCGLGVLPALAVGALGGMVGFSLGFAVGAGLGGAMIDLLLPDDEDGDM